MYDALMAGFRKDFQEARRFIDLIKKFQALKIESARFRDACKARDYETARDLYLQAARTSRL